MYRWVIKFVDDRFRIVKTAYADGAIEVFNAEEAMSLRQALTFVADKAHLGDKVYLPNGSQCAFSLKTANA
jgi:hypothetical protein